MHGSSYPQEPDRQADNRWNPHILTGAAVSAFLWTISTCQVQVRIEKNKTKNRVHHHPSNPLYSNESTVTPQQPQWSDRRPNGANQPFPSSCHKPPIATVNIITAEQWQIGEAENIGTRNHGLTFSLPSELIAVAVSVTTSRSAEENCLTAYWFSVGEWGGAG